MKKMKILGFVLAEVLCVAASYALGRFLRLYTARFMLMGISVVLVALFFFIPRRAKKWLGGVCVAGMLILATTFAYLYSCLDDARYMSVDNGFFTSDFVTNRRVLVVVPHQDDEVNLAYSMISSFVDSNSEVFILYTTNGDYFGIAEQRFSEVAKMAALYGIADDHIIMLGYGDGWQGEHIYHAAPSTQLTSADGHTKTYGLAQYSDFHTLLTGEAADYTRGNYLLDMTEAIRAVDADVIFCNECDFHADHRATSLLFDEAMGHVLRSDPTYRPQVFKGYAYDTAWYAPKDFYASAIISTLKPDYGASDTANPVYRWSERVRFPIANAYLSYTIKGSKIDGLLSAHDSQNAIDKAEQIANGDQVFWQRRTDSLTFTAAIESGHADAELLRDFKLSDMTDIADKDGDFDAGIWSPDSNEPSVTFTWDEPVTIGSVVLYDNPSQADNVLSAMITLADGTAYMTGELSKQGNATCIQIGETTTDSVCVTLLDTEGANAGLTEIEIFAPEQSTPPQLVQLLDEEDNFLYNLSLREGEARRFKTYLWPPQDLSIAVELTSINGEEQPGAVRNESGDILLDGLPRGIYSLKASCAGATCEVILTVGERDAFVTVLQRLESLIRFLHARLNA